MAREQATTYHVRTTARTKDGNTVTHSIPVQGKGGFSDSHLASLGAQLPQYSGVPDRFTVHTDRNGTPGRRLLRPGIQKQVIETAGDHISAQEIETAKHITNALHPMVRQREEAYYTQLKKDEKTDPIHHRFVRDFMYKDGPIPVITAQQLIAHPNKAIAATVHYLNAAHVQHADRQISILETFIEKAVIAGGEFPIAGPIGAALVDDVLAAKNILLDPGGSTRGKGAELAAAALNTAGNIAASATDLEGVGELIAFSVNVAFDPIAIKRAVHRVNDERYMLQALAAIELLKPGSPITPKTRGELAKAVRQHVGNGLLKQATKVEIENANQPRGYYSGLIRQLNEAAQSVR